MSERQPIHLVSRHLVIGWCAYLLASWLMHLTVETPQWAELADHPHRLPPPDLLVPAARGMLMSIMVGLGLLWPVWRLSQAPRGQCGVRTMTDLLLLLLVLQVVIWPLRAAVGWTLMQTLTIDAVFVIWGAAAGLLVWIGTRSAGPGVRTAAAGGCSLLLIGPWIGLWITGRSGPAAWSPLYQLWVLAGADRPYDWLAIPSQLSIAAAAVAMLWALAAVAVSAGRGRSSAV